MLHKKKGNEERDCWWSRQGASRKLFDPSIKNTGEELTLVEIIIIITTFQQRSPLPNPHNVSLTVGGHHPYYYHGRCGIEVSYMDNQKSEATR